MRSDRGASTVNSLTKNFGWILILLGIAVFLLEAFKAVSLENNGLWRLGRLCRDIGLDAPRTDWPQLATLVESLMYLPVGAVLLAAGASIVGIGGWLTEIWGSRHSEPASALPETPHADRP